MYLIDIPHLNQQISIFFFSKKVIFRSRKKNKTKEIKKRLFQKQKKRMMIYAIRQKNNKWMKKTY